MAIATVSDRVASGGKARAGLQRFGGFLAGMVMPNIPAFIAWGLITAFFIPTGWTPNAHINQLVTPLVSFLLPILIGFTGGRLVAGNRGGVVGAIATAGVAVGSSQPMFIGAMIMGPLGGYLIKQFDRLVEGKIKAGFEMIVNTFSGGIIGGGLAILSFLVVQPVMDSVSKALGAAAIWVTSVHLLPLIAIFIEPGKVLFLNNAINHGILDPIGLQQAKETGKSIFFLLETDPGPGLGVLVAYWIFGKGSVRQSAPGAILIQFFGGIHEIYFPYILMKPILVLAVIFGGMAADTTFMLLHAGLVATASPGSIIAEMAMCPRGGYLPVLAGIFVGALVSLLIASFFLSRSKTEMNDDDLAFAQSVVADMKAQSKGQTTQQTTVNHAEIGEATGEGHALTHIPQRVIFACEAGMGSSAMGASLLKKQLKEAGYDIPVDHLPVNQLPVNAEVVFTQSSLSDRARQVAPNAKIYIVDNFLDKSTYQQLVTDLNALK
ncbi:PTS mannitol transporter subunit IICB [Alicyclobacillus cycloheptanicus]|uniref:PTS system mannitol-specific EIICB component n=1 Tax=Alicyclobacillus cycloheptanicus TaxID=1457 RepID=A0ABT9XGS5_9BACL|nr:PTS mannitol transporter subunit IICB [Alicyclobacillus cycloheptanicus]MDQ0189493.1 PTS system mannitol-specific IIC component [Alicyclobacillus cycloheptanicus]WDM01557.1 PTS mannitol transporter subunit IICB [Alicyclobacillus cycloheptanicus]